MVRKAAEIKDTFLIKIKSHRVISKDLHFLYRRFFSSIAPYLPDMEFVINWSDHPRILKHKCRPDQKWTECACDAGFKLPPHGLFLTSRNDLSTD